MTRTTFEDRLLRELRAVVATRPAPERVAAPARTIRARLILAAGVVAATAAGVFVATGGDTASPAYAVEKQPDGSVTVAIHSVSDAAGLQGKLRAAGIPAVVDYTPNGKMCAEPRGQRAISGHGMRMAMRMGVRVRADRSATFTISRSGVRPGQTLVVTSSVGSSVSSLGAEVIAGPVASCKLVDAPPLPQPGPNANGSRTSPGFSTSGSASGGTPAGPVTHTGP
ncbi:MAG: hypothetical protein QOD66_2810 [Solirubrobacteraceae bacterium]|jgi:hypothetical protein|nr:hypothetical protein [Solirubrobacteraceae bacterium]